MCSPLHGAMSTACQTRQDVAQCSVAHSCGMHLTALASPLLHATVPEQQAWVLAAVAPASCEAPNCRCAASAAA